MRFENNFSAATLEGSTLLIPSVSIANIPQLASDVLLHTLGFQKVATLSDEYLYPFISPIDHAAVKEAPKGISHALEVFFCAEHKLTLVQQRSPILPGFANKQVADVIIPFVKKGQFSRAVLLHSLDAGLATESLPGDIQVFSFKDVLSDSLESLKLATTSEQPLNVLSRDTSPYARLLVESIPKVLALSLVAIHVYEGDNFYDAQIMSRKIAEILSINVEQWQTPVSWYGVYGDKPVPSAMEDGLYG